VAHRQDDGDEVHETQAGRRFLRETAGACTLFMQRISGFPFRRRTPSRGRSSAWRHDQTLGIKWGWAERIIWAWIFTIPLSALIAALCFWLIEFLHPAV
jgi:PiT family inorganic phosphate transporter